MSYDETDYQRILEVSVSPFSTQYGDTERSAYVVGRVFLQDRYDRDSTRSPSFSAWPELKGALKHCEFDCFRPEVYTTARRDGQNGYWHANLEFSQPYTVTLERAESMARVLRTTRKGLTALETRFGVASSIGGWFAYVAEAIKADAVRVPAGKILHDGRNYRQGPAGDMVYHINRNVEAWKQQIAQELGWTTEEVVA